jgi:hypothetical protein
MAQRKRKRKAGRSKSHIDNVFNRPSEKAKHKK